MSVSAAIIESARLYALVGAAVAAVFLTVGIDRIDEDARGAYVFRPLLIPAVLLIWPVVLWRWYRIETGRVSWQRHYDPPRPAHRVAAVLMAAAVLSTLAAGFTLRQNWPAEVAPIRLTQPEAPE